MGTSLVTHHYCVPLNYDAISGSWRHFPWCFPASGQPLPFLVGSCAQFLPRAAMWWLVAPSHSSGKPRKPRFPMHSSCSDLLSCFFIPKPSRSLGPSGLCWPLFLCLYLPCLSPYPAFPHHFHQVLLVCSHPCLANLKDLPPPSSGHF